MDYDSAWKEVLDKLFEEFLAFFFPEVHQHIDFSKGYQFLEQELRQIAVPSETGKRINSLWVLEELMEKLPLAETITQAEEIFRQVQSQVVRK